MTWSRWDSGWVLAIGLAGLILRLGYAIPYAGHPLGQLPWVDEGAYWSRASEILAGRWLPARPFYQDPLLPYLLAILMKVVGTDVATLRVTLAGLGSLTPVVLFLAGRRGLGRAEGVVAGAILAIYGPLIFADGLLEKEGPAALLAALAWLATARASGGVGRSDLGWIGLSGWLWGLLALLRANALLIGPVGVLWALATARKSRVARASLFLAGFAMAILPSTIINAWVGRPPELILTTYQSGANFYIGNGPGATGTYQAPDFVEASPAREADDFEAEAWRRSGRPLSPSQVSRFWMAEGLARWREAPGDSARILGTKLELLMHDFEVPDNEDLEFIRIVASPRLAWCWIGFGWLVPVAALGLTGRVRSSFRWLLVTVTLLGFFSTAAFFVVGRYRVPWTPGLALLAGAGLAELGHRVKDRAWIAVSWRIVLVVVPVAVLAWRPIADPAPDRWGHALIMLATAELNGARLEPAIDALDDARAFSTSAAVRVGEITAGGPVHDRLVDLIRVRIAAARGGPTLPDVSKARWLRQVPEGRLESRALLDKALLADPDDPEALRESAGWWLAATDLAEARRIATGQLESARRTEGGDPRAALILGLLERRSDCLPRPDLSAHLPDSTRLALARAILDERRFEKATGR